jgi:hypothetical protein
VRSSVPSQLHHEGEQCHQLRIVLAAHGHHRGHTSSEDRCNSGIRRDRHEAVGPEGSEDKRPRGKGIKPGLRRHARQPGGRPRNRNRGQHDAGDDVPRQPSNPMRLTSSQNSRSFVARPSRVLPAMIAELIPRLRCRRPNRGGGRPRRVLRRHPPDKPQEHRTLKQKCDAVEGRPTFQLVRLSQAGRRAGHGACNRHVVIERGCGEGEGGWPSLSKKWGGGSCEHRAHHLAQSHLHWRVRMEWPSLPGQAPALGLARFMGASARRSRWPSRQEEPAGETRFCVLGSYHLQPLWLLDRRGDQKETLRVLPLHRI